MAIGPGGTPTIPPKKNALLDDERTAARWSMYTMLMLTSIAHFLTREMGPQLIPFICDEFGFDAQQRGVLLGAYFPGYVVGQLPAAMLADRIGGKRVISPARMSSLKPRSRPRMFEPAPEGMMTLSGARKPKSSHSS